MRDDGTPASSRQRLIESLWQDARREAEQQVQKARLKAEGLAEEGRLFLEGELALAAEKAQSEALPHVSRILNRARGRAKQLILGERIAFLNSCFDDAADRTRKNKDFLKKARASFESLLGQALSALGEPENIEASLNPEDISSASRILDGKGIENDLFGDGNISGGISLKVQDGTMVADNTIEGRLSVLRETPPIGLLKLIRPKQD